MEKEQERKLSAIMFTDMVGYSALVQENETLALELLEEHRQILRSFFLKYGGREVDTAGDVFLQSDPRFQEILAKHKELYEKNLAKYGDGDI